MVPLIWALHVSRGEFADVSNVGNGPLKFPIRTIMCHDYLLIYFYQCELCLRDIGLYPKVALVQDPNHRHVRGRHITVTDTDNLYQTSIGGNDGTFGELGVEFADSGGHLSQLRFGLSQFLIPRAALNEFIICLLYTSDAADE